MTFSMRDLMVDVLPTSGLLMADDCQPVTITGDDEKPEEPECPAPSCAGGTREPEPEEAWQASAGILAELHEQLRLQMNP